MASRFHLSGVFLPGSFFPSFRLWISKTVRRSALCRSRQELSNEYLLAKFGFDTAENEPYHFVSSSSREFEFELWNFKPLICNPVYVKKIANLLALTANYPGNPVDLRSLQFRPDWYHHWETWNGSPFSIFPRLVFGCINADLGK